MQKKNIVDQTMMLTLYEYGKDTKHGMKKMDRG